MPGSGNDAYSGHDRRTPAARSRAKLIELIPAFGLAGLIWYFEVWLITALQSARCPASTFLSGSPNLASIFVMVAPGFAALAPGFWLSNLLTGALPATRRFFDGDVEFRRSPQFRRSQAAMLAVGGFVAAVALPISFVASFSQFCLTPSSILNRDTPLRAMRSYSWSDVRTVTTSCVPGSKDSWVPGYKLGLSDGRTLDIMDGTAPAWKRQPQLFAALHPVNFRFDASGVPADCDVANVDILVRRP